jgi:hypothetical protein
VPTDISTELNTRFDFGIPVAHIGNPGDNVLDIPDEVARRRAERAEAENTAKPLVTMDEAKGQAEAAIIAEVQHTGVSFVFDGDTYWVPLVDDWDLDIYEAQESGKLVTMVQSILGVAQYAQFKTTDDGDGGRIVKKRTLKDLLSILNASAAAAGGKSKSS